MYVLQDGNIRLQGKRMRGISVMAAGGPGQFILYIKGKWWHGSNLFGLRKWEDAGVRIICQIALVRPYFSLSSPEWADSPWGLIAAVPSEQVVREQRTDREELGEWVCINKALDRNQDGDGA